jgi:hypothetical protein
LVGGIRRQLHLLALLHERGNVLLSTGVRLLRLDHLALHERFGRAIRRLHS